ncbi:TIR domain-containing protein [Rhizobium panacihumi]|uniref:toll/interleukin-1 receptor domain-containing protein n=1 Tax=Rhizobium panacihumi TaxID=2008450 RepID=UPI003D78CA8D
MLPTVFLSLEGADEAYVAQIQRFLPDGLAYFYPKSFETGENLISAMEERVGKSSMFVLFASKKSVASCWVGFEIDQARIAKIKNPGMKIIVVPTDPELSYADLPNWMKAYWVGNVGKGSRDVARYIRRSLIAGLLSQTSNYQVYGRGALIDQTLSDITEVVVKSQKSPNVFVVAGNTGIGRRTFVRKLLTEAFPSSPNLNYGPEFILPQFADLEDIYRALRQEVEIDIPLSTFEADSKAFKSAETSVQVEEIVTRFRHFGGLGQAVTLITGNGIYEDRGYLKSWVQPLISRLNRDEKVKVLFVTNRSIHENELRAFSNLVQVSVPHIEDRHIKTLMVQTLAQAGRKPDLPPSDIIMQIGGHPGIARATAALIGRKGPTILKTDPRDFFQLQEDVLGECLNFKNLTNIQRDVLSVLSWVPQLSGETLLNVICKQHNIQKSVFGEEVNNLLLSCLVDVVGANYAIAGPVRTLFRRLHGYGSKPLMSEFSQALKSEWESAKQDGKLRNELLDALTYMAALEGGTFPQEFKQLLLPSTLQEVVRDTYDRSHDDPSMLDQVVTWGSVARTLPMDETTREEILSYVVRALARLESEPAVEDFLQFFEERRYRSRFYLRAFYLRVHHHDYRGAIAYLIEAKAVRKYQKQVVGDLARCYQKEGMWSELRDLVRDQGQYIGRNGVLLDVRIGMLIAEGQYPEAERQIEILKTMRGQEIYAEGRTAMIKMRRDRDFKGAQDMLTSLIQRGTSAHTYIRKLRAISAASNGDLLTARGDVDFLETRIGTRDVTGLRARIKLAEDDFAGAEAELSRFARPTAQEELLRARILESKADHHTTAFTQREELRKEAAWLRAKHVSLDEFEVGR